MKISDRDWVQLSAFLDGELNPKEQDQISNRIEADPALSSALESLKKVKDVLHQTPQIPLPRSFTLKPAQVGIKSRPRPVFRGYSLAAALTAFLFVAVLAVDFGSLLLGGAMAPAMAPRSQEIMLEAAPEAADGLMEEPALLAAEGESAAGDEAVQLLEEAAPAPAAEAESAAEVDSLGEETGEQAKSTLDEEMPQEPAFADNLARGGEDSAEPGLSAGLTPDPESWVPVTEQEDQAYQAQPASLRSILRGLEIILGAGILGFGSAAWLKQRRGRRD